MARTIGWVSNPIVSIIISTGIRRVNVPCGRKLDRDDFVL